MFNGLRKALDRYLHENIDDLLALDLKVARLIGIPAPHTISSWAHVKGGLPERFIDRLFAWLDGQTNHCLNDFNRVIKESIPK